MEKLSLGNNTHLIFLEMSLSHSVFCFCFLRKSLQFTCKQCLSGGGLCDFSPETSPTPLGVHHGAWRHHRPGGSGWATCLSRPSSRRSTPSGPALQLVFLPGHPASPGSWGSTGTMSRCRGLRPARSFSVFCSGRKSPRRVSR